jgi:hypothetical protein
MSQESQAMIFLLVTVAAFAAGFINAVAGGGSFLTFPALIAAGLPAIDANASNTVAHFPAQLTTGFAARDGLGRAYPTDRFQPHRPVAHFFRDAHICGRQF